MNRNRLVIAAATVAVGASGFAGITAATASASPQASAVHYVNGVRCFRIKVLAYRAYPGHLTYRIHGCEPTPDATPSAAEVRHAALILALPQWLHVGRVRYFSDCHGKGIIVWQANGNTSALHCRNGKTFVS